MVMRTIGVEMMICGIEEGAGWVLRVQSRVASHSRKRDGVGGPGGCGYAIDRGGEGYGCVSWSKALLTATGERREENRVAGMEGWQL